MLTLMGSLLRTIALILLLGGLSPALAGIAWVDVSRARHPRPMILCPLRPPQVSPAKRTHWPAEFYGRKAPPRR